ncbi:acyl-CoA thioesterase [Algirhabdus cladophorae]|uniref:acyl-CoA thioesterase n=1 Tax=Algirhabdus cladophorae TaxID=3377108 RepID=UPI003B848EFE
MSRNTYAEFRTIPTRWADNDIYGHMNNVVHYALFDTAVNGWLVSRGLLNMTDSPTVFLVVETGCSYRAEMAYPDDIHAGIRIAKLGSSSIRYEVGLFPNDAASPAAEGHFIHVQVDRATRRPVPLSVEAREILSDLLVS